MRITNKMASDRALSDLYRTMGRLMEAEEQLSSMKRVNRPSDDPFSTHEAISARGQVLLLTQYSKNITNVSGWVGATDTALSSVTDALQSVRTLAVSAANSYLDSTDRESIALQIDQQAESILQLSNQTFSGRYIFSGTRTSTEPFSLTAGGVSYNGNSSRMTRNIGPDATVDMNVTGDEVFMGLSGGNDVFKLLSDLSAAVRAGSVSEVGGGLLAGIDEAIDRVLEKSGLVGATTNRLEKMEAMVSMLKERQIGLLSEAEDVDIAEAVMKLSVNQTAYQATLAATAKVILPSLIDYLR